MVAWGSSRAFGISITGTQCSAAPGHTSQKSCPKMHLVMVFLPLKHWSP